MNGKKLFTLLAFFLLTFAANGQVAQSPVEPVKLSVNWEELTAPDFAQAISLSEGVCIIPMGVIEKHGPHLPLGTDVFTSREISKRAASKEYCVVFPFYLAGQIYEAKHQPGTIAYSPELIYKILDETCQELSRNGFKKILIVNGHGGNNNFVTYFCQTQLAKQKDYALYVFTPEVDKDTQKKIASMRKTTTGGHADEAESSVMMLFRPELVKIDKAANQSGEDQMRLKLSNAYTPIWWYAKYPNHYAGDARDANPALGEVIVNQKVQQLSEVIKAVKADKETLKLQNEFYKECMN
ncbi:MAG: creatininase family protein [Bacteroidales bacterium]|jgi:creatinine amidohydrolase